MEVFMKVLLTAINAKYIHSNLAVYSLRAYAGKYAQQTEIAEYTINQTMDDICLILQEKTGYSMSVLLFMEYFICGAADHRDSQSAAKMQIWLAGRKCLTMQFL